MWQEDVVASHTCRHGSARHSKIEMPYAISLHEIETLLNYSTEASPPIFLQDNIDILAILW